MPIDDPIAQLLGELVTTNERHSGRIQAAEKSLDAVVVESRATTAAVLDLATAVKGLIDRIDRERAREDAREERRSQWVARIWSSQPVQMLLMGLVLAAMNVLGVAYLAQEVQTVPVQPESPRPPVEAPVTP